MKDIKEGKINWCLFFLKYNSKKKITEKIVGPSKIYFHEEKVDYISVGF